MKAKTSRKAIQSAEFAINEIILSAKEDSFEQSKVKSAYQRS